MLAERDGASWLGAKAKSAVQAPVADRIVAVRDGAERDRCAAHATLTRLGSAAFTAVTTP